MRGKQALITLAATITLLAGCGATANATSPGSSTTLPTPSSALNGCPTQHIPIDGRPGGNKVVVTNTGAQNQAVKVSVGATVVFQLPATWRWNAKLTDSTGVLGEMQPEGYYNSALQVCNWSYYAHQAGTATISFTGTPVCEAGKPCEALARVQSYDITVK